MSHNLMPHDGFLTVSRSMMWHFGVVESKSATFPTEKPRHLLDDSFLESQSPARNNPHSSSVSNGVSIGSSQSSFCEDLSPGVESSSVAESSLAHGESGGVTMEGPLKRKTLLKEGRKPKLASWTRYWITLCGSTLIFYGSKALRATERKHYKSSPCKKVCVVGWMVVLPDDPAQPNIFQLNHPDKGNVYKFQTSDRFTAIMWHRHLEEASRRRRPQIPANLMSFE